MSASRRIDPDLVPSHPSHRFGLAALLWPLDDDRARGLERGGECGVDHARMVVHVCCLGVYGMPTVVPKFIWRQVRGGILQRTQGGILQSLDHPPAGVWVVPRDGAHPLARDHPVPTRSAATLGRIGISGSLAGLAAEGLLHPKPRG